MKRAKATNAAAVGPGLRVVYCHHAGGTELEVFPQLRPERSGYPTAWEWALCQVDTRRGGYVRELDAAGNVVRQHPAGDIPAPYCYRNLDNQP